MFTSFAVFGLDEIAKLAFVSDQFCYFLIFCKHTCNPFDCMGFSTFLTFNNSILRT